MAIKIEKAFNQSTMVVYYEDDRTRARKSLGCINTQDIKNNFTGTIQELIKELPFDKEVIVKFQKALDELIEDLKIYA